MEIKRMERKISKVTKRLPQLKKKLTFAFGPDQVIQEKLAT
jgi:chaperonin cofactor prefoldin